MSKHHDRIKNDPRWKAARVEVLDRDGYACTCPGCEACGTGCASTEQLEIDHVVPLAEVIDTAPELAFDPANLATLCRPCHQHKKTRDDETRNQWINPKWADVLNPIL